VEHRLITGGSEYLPIARAWVRKLKKLGLPYADQSFRFNGIQIRIQVTPGHEFIYIERTSGQTYEFFTSDAGFSITAEGSLGTYGLVVGGDPAYQSGCGAMFVGGKAKPLFANTLGDGEKWPKIPVDDYAYLNPAWFKIIFAPNNQRLQPQQWWKDNKFDDVITSCNAWGVGRTWFTRYVEAPSLWENIHMAYEPSGGVDPDVTWYPFSYLHPCELDTEGYRVPEEKGGYEIRRVPFVTSEGPDFFDVIPARLSLGATTAAAHKRSVHVNWRHAACCVADNGEVFCVSTDTHGAFSFYKFMSEFTPDVIDLPDDKVVVVTPNYPAWVTLTPDTESNTVDHWLWRFNKNGTKAVTTPLSKTQTFVYPSTTVYTDGDGQQRISTAIDITGLCKPAEMQMPVYIRKAGSSSEAMIVDVLGRAVPILALSSGSSVVMLLTEFETTYPTVESVIADYVPVNDTIPGFCEVSISVSVDPDTGEFSPVVAVTSSEQYSDQENFFVDTGYFISTDRTKRRKDEELEAWTARTGLLCALADDELLTAKVDVYSRIANYETGPEWAPITVHQFASGYMSFVGIHVNLVIQRRSDGAVVKRLCLVNNGSLDMREPERDAILTTVGPRAVGKSYLVDDGDPLVVTWMLDSAMYGTIDLMDIRYLMFLTASRSRRKVTIRIGNGEKSFNGVDNKFPTGHANSCNLNPRFELRVPGEKLRTVDYSVPYLTGFSAETNDATGEYGPDPMTTHTDPPETRELPTATDAGKLAALWLKMFYTLHMIHTTRLDVMAMSPTGSWAVYADRRATSSLPADRGPNVEYIVPMEIQATSTEPSGVFDRVVSVTKGDVVRKTHKSLFNSAFGQERDYSFYTGTENYRTDFGGFATYGAWH